MRDYNFFDRQINLKRSVHKKSMTIIAIIVTVVLIISGSYAAIEVTSAGIQADTTSMKVYLSSRDVSAKNDEIQEQKLKLDIMNRYFSAVKAVKADIDSVNIVKGSFLDEINKVLPKGVVLDKMSLTSTSLTLVGSAGSSMEVAELLHNLNSLGIFDSVFAGGTNKANPNIENYTFDIKCSIKGAEAK